jgi:hypothetical protein
VASFLMISAQPDTHCNASRCVLFSSVSGSANFHLHLVDIITSVARANGGWEIIRVWEAIAAIITIGLQSRKNRNHDTHASRETQIVI